MERIDLDTASKIHEVLILCRSKGGNPVRVLDQARMLRHKGTRREDGVQLLTDIIDIVSGRPLTRDIKTPMDAKNLILKWLEEMKNDIAAQH